MGTFGEKKKTIPDPLKLAFAFLTRKDRTENEVRKRLLEKGVVSYQIDETISYLKQYGYIDDAAYCRKWIGFREKTRPVGSAYAIRKLKALGINAVTIEQTLEHYFSEEDQLRTAKEALVKKSRGKDLADVKEKARCFRFLQNRGFPRHIAWRVIHDFIDTE